VQETLVKFDGSLARPVAGVKPAALLLLAALALAGCANPGGIVSKATLRDAQSAGLPVEQVAMAPVDAQWWHQFGDAQLNRLIDDALSTHPTLGVVQARLTRAQAGADLTAAAGGPQLNAGLDLTRQQYTSNGAVPAPLAGSVRSTGTAQLSGSWEIDFFGKNRAALEAALGNTRAAQADLAAARTLLASQVARTYFQWLRLNDQQALAQRLLAQRNQALQLVQARVSAGLDSNVELRQAEATLPEVRLQIESLQEQRALTQNTLNALVFKPNQLLVVVSHGLIDIKIIAPVGSIPADLLGRRADISAARWRVEAATQDVSSARAQFYPNVNLMAFAGFSSIGLDRLISTGSEQWGMGPALRLPLFDGGRLRAHLAGKTADLDGAIESYNACVIDAVRDVADQLAMLQAVGRQQEAHRAAQAVADSSHAFAVQRHGAGLGNLLPVIAAQVAVLNQQRAGLDLQARVLDTQVALMRALGGGYRAELPAPKPL
jgi:NodT family efflux transporter outer membrane factor (OMF) lipoprotein